MPSPSPSPKPAQAAPSPPAPAMSSPPSPPSSPPSPAVLTDIPTPKSLLPPIIPPKPTISQTSLKTLIPLLSKFNANVTDTNTLDTTLLTLTYSIRLLLSTSHLPFSGLKALSALIDDLRIRLRLFSLPVYILALLKLLARRKQSGAAEKEEKEENTVDRAVEWTQVLSMLVFQAAENVAYLGDQKVLKLRSGTVNQYWLWSSRAWALWTGLELLRLERVRRARYPTISSPPPPPPAEKSKDDITNLITRAEPTEAELQEKTAKLAISAREFERQRKEEKEWWRGWRKDVLVQAVYLPMTLHYSFERGLVGEKSLAGMGVGIAGLAWGML